MLNIIYSKLTLEVLSVTNYKMLLTERFYSNHRNHKKKDLESIEVYFDGDLQYTDIKLIRNEQGDVEAVFTELPIPPTPEEQAKDKIQAELQGLQMALAEVTIMLYSTKEEM